MVNICWPNSYKNYLVKVLFNSRRTSIWITFVFSIFAEVRFKEFSVLQTAKGPFFDILIFLGARRLILVNMCWPNVFQINLTWKFPSRGTENAFESCSYLQYSRSYNQKNFECYSPLRDTTPYHMIFQTFWYFFIKS